MKIAGPDKYKLICSSNSFEVQSPNKTNKFSGMATASIPKIYIIVNKGIPIYVGSTVQSIRKRLRAGFKATGEHGYRGYPWKGKVKNVDLLIWYLEDVIKKKWKVEMETVESEVVFLIRENFNWPQYQTEIHFHRSKKYHRRLARKIVSKYITDQESNSKTKGKYQKVFDTLMGKYGVKKIPLKLRHKILVESFKKNNDLLILRRELNDSDKTKLVVVTKVESTKSKDRLAEEIENKSARIKIIERSGEITDALYYPEEPYLSLKQVPINEYFKSEILYGYAKFFDFVRKQVWDCYPELMGLGVVSDDRFIRNIAQRISDVSWYTSQVLLNSDILQFLKTDKMSHSDDSSVNLKHRIDKNFPGQSVEESLNLTDEKLIRAKRKLDESYPGSAESIRDYFNRYLQPFAPDKIVKKWDIPTLELKNSLQKFVFLPSYYYPLTDNEQNLYQVKSKESVDKNKKKSIPENHRKGDFENTVKIDFLEFPLSAVHSTNRLHMWDLDFEFNYFHINLAIQMYTLDSNINSFDEALEYVVYFFDSSHTRNEKELYWRILLLLIWNTAKKKKNLKRVHPKHLERFIDFVFALTQDDRLIIIEKFTDNDFTPDVYHKNFVNLRKGVTRLKERINEISPKKDKTETKLLKYIKRDIDDISLEDDYVSFVDSYKKLINIAKDPANYIPNFRINKDKKSNQ